MICNCAYCMMRCDVADKHCGRLVVCPHCGNDFYAPRLGTTTISGATISGNFCITFDVPVTITIAFGGMESSRNVLTCRPAPTETLPYGIKEVRNDPAKRT
jgi:hypothetical protein